MLRPVDARGPFTQWGKIRRENVWPFFYYKLCFITSVACQLLFDAVIVKLTEHVTIWEHNTDHREWCWVKCWLTVGQQLNYYIYSHWQSWRHIFRCRNAHLARDEWLAKRTLLWQSPLRLVGCWGSFGRVANHYTPTSSWSRHFSLQLYENVEVDAQWWALPTIELGWFFSRAAFDEKVSGLLARRPGWRGMVIRAAKSSLDSARRRRQCHNRCAFSSSCGCQFKKYEMVWNSGASGWISWHV